MIESDIPTFVTDDETINSLIDGRIYFARLQSESTYPAIIYHRISTIRDRTVSGSNGRTIARFQFDCVAESGTETKQLAAAILARFDDYSGALGSTTVRNSVVDSERDDSFDRDARTYRTIIDILITYDEE